MQAFLKWFEAPPDMDLVLKAGLAHLWFVTIHPFDDGNGRIARAITEMALARSENSPQRFYSMSAHIRQERNDYYDILERTQAPWISGAAVMTYARVRCPEDERSPRRDPRYATLLDDEIPLTEYLKDTVARVLPYWDKTIAPAAKAGKRAISLGRPYSCS